jgi:hypothetical protein
LFLEWKQVAVSVVGPVDHEEARQGCQGGVGNPRIRKKELRRKL